MKISSLSTLALMVSLSPLVACAQPDTNNNPKAENPANRAPRGERPDANASPEARLKWFIKRQFGQLGADDATQETLVTFTQNELKARQDLQEKGQPLQVALRAGALSDTQIAALLNAYQVALEDEKTRRDQAIAALDKSIDFKKSPKIEAALTIAGLIGDGPMLNMGGGMGRIMMGGQNGRGQNGNANGRGDGNANGNANRNERRNNRETPAPAPAADPAQGV